MSEETLFPGYVPAFPMPMMPPGLSADRKRTLRQRADVARGVHPLVGGPLTTIPEARCGNCTHLFTVQHHDRRYLKCTVRGDSSSAASDARRWWPGCTRWEAKP